MVREKLYFECPSCGCDNLTSDESSNSSIVCRACGAEFVCKKGIPRLVNLENYSASFGFQWNKHAKTQLDSYSGLDLSKNRVLAATGWKTLDVPRGQRILEAGSGAGRFTEVLVKTGGDIHSFDYSDAVEANYSNNGQAKNLTLFQGDIYRIPYKDQTFDWVICLGVIQHTPDPRGAFFSLEKKVAPGGWLVIDVYTLSAHHLFQWKYFLRPITRRLPPELLYRCLAFLIPFLLPPTRLLKLLLGRFGARMSPIVEYSGLGLGKTLNEKWALLDSFDMYSPAHDHPQSISTVERWFKEAGFTDIKLCYGANGIVGRGRKPS